MHSTGAYRYQPHKLTSMNKHLMQVEHDPQSICPICNSDWWLYFNTALKVVPRGQDTHTHSPDDMLLDEEQLEQVKQEFSALHLITSSYASFSIQQNIWRVKGQDIRRIWATDRKWVIWIQHPPLIASSDDSAAKSNHHSTEFI